MKIIRVLSVTDTREWLEGPDDKWHPVPGSGIVRACDRCSREHEVHATVELDDGSTACVGTGCARQDTTEVREALRRGATVAKRAARLSHELAAAVDALARMDDAMAHAQTLTPPPLVVREVTRTVVRKDTVPVWAVGDEYLHAQVGATPTEDDRRYLTESWVLRRAREKYGEWFSRYDQRRMIDRIQKRLEKAQALTKGDKQ